MWFMTQCRVQADLEGASVTHSWVSVVNNKFYFPKVRFYNIRLRLPTTPLNTTCVNTPLSIALKENICSPPSITIIPTQIIITFLSTIFVLICRQTIKGTLRSIKWGTEGIDCRKHSRSFQSCEKSNWCRRISYISTTGGFINGRRSIQIRIEVNVLDYIMREVLLIECEDEQ